jgi:hypothetical protein
LSEQAKSYPGEGARAPQVLALADAYRRAALSLDAKGSVYGRAPRHLAAIHAIELYLNALLLHDGMAAGCVRGLQHDLASRTRLAMEKGLSLRRRTAEHLASMTGNREYLVARYAPEMQVALSRDSRLMATLDEVARKVGQRLEDGRQVKLTTPPLRGR